MGGITEALDTNLKADKEFKIACLSIYFLACSSVDWMLNLAAYSESQADFMKNTAQIECSIVLYQNWESAVLQLDWLQ